jgi:hypothetical protein
MVNSEKAEEAGASGPERKNHSSGSDQQVAIYLSRIVDWSSELKKKIKSYLF